jgi:hypothetical protein|tara:strand:+ start:2447 stop:3304 length:858 start_codon:yes stop_codon:yes gene_type:complete
MQSTELTKPVSLQSLLTQFESRFGQTIKLEGMDKNQLEDVANHIRTKIHTITDNLHFGQELNNNEYQKNQSMLDIVNQAIREYNDMNTTPMSQADQQQMVKRVKQSSNLSKQDKEKIIGDLMTDSKEVKEGVEEQSELILAAKDMMDKVTGYLEDLASMKTEGMLELADRIRDEMGADKADAFLQKIQPAIEQAEATLTTTRQELDNGVRILTGEEMASDPMGADDTMNVDTDLDSLDSEGGEETDEFGASDAEAGGTEPEGREQRESREVFEASNRILGKLAGK